MALNPETAKQDMLELDTGGAAIYEENFNLKQYRSDVACYPVPFDKITAAVCPEAKLRKLVKNMVYVGVVAQLLSIDLAVVEASVKKQFAKKQKVFDLNFAAVKAGFDYAQQKLHQAGSLLHRADEPDRRQDHHRRQRGLRHGRCLRGCHGGCVVSHHAVDLAD